MAFKTVTTILTELPRDQSALDMATGLATKRDAHLDVICLGVDRTQPGFYYAGANAMAIQSNLVEAEARAKALDASVKSQLEGTPLKWASTVLATQSAGLSQFLAYHTRYSDLAILPQPYGDGRGIENEAIVESALFEAQLPVLVIPDGATAAPVPSRVVVAWNESAEALRAVRAALPMLIAADVVNIAVIDPPHHAPSRSDPGGALSQMLARHGVSAEVSVLAKTMPRVSDVIARHVDDQGADLLVMGAYGHSRFRESILGGATRNMLQQTKTPLFMAH